MTLSINPQPLYALQLLRQLFKQELKLKDRKIEWTCSEWSGRNNIVTYETE